MKLMYSFNTRFTHGLVIPALFILVLVWQLLVLYTTPGTASNVVSAQIFNLAWGIVAIIIGYFAAVAFFSLETIVHLLMRQQTTISTLIQRAKSRSFGRNLQVMESWDLKEPYKITNSILFEALLLVVALYASMVSSALTGRVMVLTVLFILLAEQTKRLFRGSDLNNWYWQVRQHISRDTQVMIYILMAIFYLWILSLTLF